MDSTGFENVPAGPTG